MIVEMNKAVFEQCKCSQKTETMKKQKVITKKNISLIFPDANITEKHNMPNEKMLQRKKHMRVIQYITKMETQ